MTKANWMVMVMILLSRVMPAAAADLICLDPPPSDQTMWDGRDGTLAYCSPKNVDTSCVVIFDGVMFAPGGIPMSPAGTRVEFRHEQAGFNASAQVRCANSEGVTGEVTPLAIFRDEPVADPVPAVLLP